MPGLVPGESVVLAAIVIRPPWVPLPPIVVPATRLIGVVTAELSPFIRSVPLETVVVPAY